MALIRLAALAVALSVMLLMGTARAAGVPPVAPTVGANRVIAGDWVLHLFIGNHQFDDRVHLDVTSPSAFTGTVVVPARWSAPIERGELTPTGISFDIHAPEGPKPFVVRYEGTFSSDGTTFIGFATMPETGGYLGGFVAYQPKAAVVTGQ